MGCRPDRGGIARLPRHRQVHVGQAFLNPLRCTRTALLKSFENLASLEARSSRHLSVIRSNINGRIKSKLQITRSRGLPHAEDCWRRARPCTRSTQAPDTNRRFRCELRRNSASTRNIPSVLHANIQQSRISWLTSFVHGKRMQFIEKLLLIHEIAICETSYAVTRSC